MKIILEERDIIDAIRSHAETDPRQKIRLRSYRARGAKEPTFSAEILDLDESLFPPPEEDPVG